MAGSLSTLAGTNLSWQAPAASEVSTFRAEWNVGLLARERSPHGWHTYELVPRWIDRAMTLLLYAAGSVMFDE